MSIKRNGYKGVNLPDEPFLIVRPSFTAICMGIRPASKMLSALFFRYDPKGTPEEIERIATFQYSSTQEALVTDMCGEVCTKTLHDTAIPCLRALGYVDIDTSSYIYTYTIHLDRINAALAAFKEKQLEVFLISSIPQLEKLPEQLEKVLNGIGKTSNSIRTISNSIGKTSNCKRGRPARPQAAAQGNFEASKNIRTERTIQEPKERIPATSQQPAALSSDDDGARAFFVEEVLTEEEPTDGMAVGSSDLPTQQHSVQPGTDLSGATPDTRRAAHTTHSAVRPSPDDANDKVTSPDEHTSIRLSDSSTHHAVPGDVIAFPDTSVPPVDALIDVQTDTDDTDTTPSQSESPTLPAMPANDTVSHIVTAQPAKTARGKKSIDGVPLVMPAGDAKWCAETAVEIIEVLKGRRYSEKTRPKELKAATDALKVKHATGQTVTREQFLVSWEKMSKWAVWKEKEIEPMIRHLLTDDRVIKLCGACVQQQTLLSASPVDAAAERARVASKNQAALDKIQAIVRKQQEAEQAQATAQKGA